jgi:hypothetical protein
LNFLAFFCNGRLKFEFLENNNQNIEKRALKI